MDNTNTIIIFLSCIFAILIFGKLFIMPIKQILKLVFNSIIGGILILIMFNFHIGLNIFTAIFVGILGIPGAVLLAIFKLILF